MEDSPITIGRKDCLVNLNSSIFSKNQSTIFWDNNKWFVSDGFIDKLSTNGTWFDLIIYIRLLLDNSFEINYSTTIKIGQNFVKVDLI